jgi:hypothetical protein
VTDPRYEQWLHSLDTGLSSKAIFYWMTLGVKGGSTPSDPSDLGRCLRLLAMFPEWRERLQEMEQVSEDWAKLIDHWDEIEQSFLAEAGGRLPGMWDGFSAPKTYDLMHKLRRA